jgi:hypothetical protein
MGVTIELQSLGDAELCREIAVGIEHALGEKVGEWRVSVAGSRETENWDMRVEGPNGFERLNGRILCRARQVSTDQRQFVK